MPAVSDFNDDFNVHVTAEQQREGGTEYNYRREPPSGETEQDATPSKTQPEGPSQGAAQSGTDVPIGMGLFLIAQGFG